MKTCKLCGIEKPLVAFYRHRREKDGRMRYCIACTKAYRKVHRGSPRAKDKTAAWCMANKARALRVILPKPCELCGTTDNVEMHHHDYNKPLVVSWLCPEHHAKVGRILRLVQSVDAVCVQLALA